MALKPDAARIRAYLSERNAKLSRDDASIPNWWPKYAFHFTDIQNAALIIQSGKIYSRRDSVARGMMVVENADTEVIARSPELTETSARFYFRPKTPTQFHNEGIRAPEERRSHNAHCPVPVFFLFPLESILCSEGTVFTDTAAYWSEVKVGETIDDLREMRWEDIYSSGPMPAERRNELTGYRRAEILVPNALGIESVHRILCRTPAERETLLYLLDGTLRKEWRGRIEISGAQLKELFEARWVYLEWVQWRQEGLFFKFNPGGSKLTIDLHITNFEDGSTVVAMTRELVFSYTNSYFKVALPESITRVRVRILLSGCLAYQATLRKLSLLKGE